VGLVVSPGVAYGLYGEGFFRLSITASEEDIKKGMARLANFVKKISA